ncbi:hypothetical protein AJ87_45135 [Rhizobium yanglingense]|nr:hypothetical protein AJ87_45135 [Rhizobium yanglingense]
MLQRSTTDNVRTPPDVIRQARRAWILFLAASAILIAAALVGAELYGRRSAIEGLESQARTDANLKVLC